MAGCHLHTGNTEAGRISKFPLAFISLSQKKLELQTHGGLLPAHKTQEHVVFVSLVAFIPHLSFPLSFGEGALQYPIPKWL